MMRLPNSGGNWTNGANAGLGALNLNNSRLNANSNIGFRPASDDTARNRHLKGCCQCLIQKDAAASVRTEKQIRPLDASGGCLYNEIIQFDALLKAAYQCRKDKAHRASTLNFFNHLEENIIDLKNELTWSMLRRIINSMFLNRKEDSYQRPTSGTALCTGQFTT